MFTVQLLPSYLFIKQEMITEQEEEYDSDESVEDELVPQNDSSIWIAKDKMEEQLVTKCTNMIS